MRQFFKKNLQLIAVSTGHFTNDFYMNLIPPILFAFSSSIGLTLTQQSMIAFIIITGGSLLQPVVGYLLDKMGMHDVKQQQPLLAKKGMFMYLHKKHKKLIPGLTKALVAMKKDGRYDRLAKKYLTVAPGK